MVIIKEGRGKNNPVNFFPLSSTMTMTVTAATAIHWPFLHNVWGKILFLSILLYGDPCAWTCCSWIMDSSLLYTMASACTKLEDRKKKKNRTVVVVGGYTHAAANPAIVFECNKSSVRQNKHVLPPVLPRKPIHSRTPKGLARDPLPIY